MVTHTESPAFLIGSGMPKGHPVFVQSMPGGVDPANVAPIVHADPVQARVKRFVAPGGVVLSGTWLFPPPRERLPHASFFSGVKPPTSRKVLPQVPLPAVERKSNPWGLMGPPVVLVVDEVVTVVVDEVVVARVELDVEDELVEVVVVLEVELELDEDTVVEVELVLVVVGTVVLDDVVAPGSVDRKSVV